MRDDWSIADDAGVALMNARVLAGVVTGASHISSSRFATPTSSIAASLGRPPYGDRIVLATEPTPGTLRWLLLATSAPGTFRAQETQPELFEPSDNYDDRVVGAWQATANGYEVEVRVPLALVGAHLGVGVIGVDRAGADYSVTLAATWDAAGGAPGRFVYQRPELGRSARAVRPRRRTFPRARSRRLGARGRGRRLGPRRRSHSRQHAFRSAAIRAAARRSAVSRGAAARPDRGRSGAACARGRERDRVVRTGRRA